MFHRESMGSRESWARVMGGALILAMAGRKSLEGPR